MAVTHSTCSLCEAKGCWDIIGELFVCPDCAEALASGASDQPLRQRIIQRDCMICKHCGTVPYKTHPYSEEQPIEIDLCPYHFAALLGRQLTSQAFGQLIALLRLRGIEAEAIFLLHREFYDPRGFPTQPVSQTWI